MRTRWAAAFMAGFVLSASMAQEAKPVGWRETLQQGELTIWIVRIATKEDKLAAAQKKLNDMIAPIKNSDEKMPTQLGQSSSDFGQTSSSYGQTSSSLGTASSNVGQTAGNAGKAPSQLGASASDVGQTAGSYGQTSSSFPGLSSLGNRTVVVTKYSHWDLEQKALSTVDSLFRGLNLHVVDVTDMEFKQKLEETKGTPEYPDVLVGTEYLPGWSQSGLGVTMLAEWPWFEPISPEQSEHWFYPGTVDLLRDAPHPEVARAFWIWATHSYAAECLSNCRDWFKPNTDEPVRVATGALQDMLGGMALGDLADKDAAEYNVGSAQRMTLSVYNSMDSVVKPEVRVEALTAFAKGNLATVALRGVVSAENAFGVVTAVAVLRRSESGAWKVLQISPNLRQDKVRMICDSLPFVGREQVKDDKPLQPVSIASPTEGDGRSMPMEIWWDNNGQAQTEVVEWQFGVGGSWLNSQLMVTHDTGSRLQTRVAASFLRMPGSYRLRVWSLGGGRLVMTPWRTFTVER